MEKFWVLQRSWRTRANALHKVNGGFDSDQQKSELSENAMTMS